MDQSWNGTGSFQKFGYDTECQTILQKESFHYLDDMDLLAGSGYSNYTDLNVKAVMDEFLLSGVLRTMRSTTAYWQLITPVMAAQTVIMLLTFSLLLFAPSLMSDYHERVCYNKEVKQTENTKLMDEQQKFEEMLLKRLLPPEIVPILPEKRAKNEMVADRFNSVSIIFCDMVGFTKFSSDLDPSELMIFLSEPGLQLNMMTFTISSVASGCRHCQAHGAFGLDKAGVPLEKIQGLWAFETSALFSDRERAALGLGMAAGVSPSASRSL